MKNVRELETYGAILIGCGIMAYTLMLASVDAPVWATIEFVMGTLFMVVGVWCVYLAGTGTRGRLSHPSNSLRVGLGTLRPLKARKSLLLGGNGS